MELTFLHSCALICDYPTSQHAALWGGTNSVCLSLLFVGLFVRGFRDGAVSHVGGLHLSVLDLDKSLNCRQTEHVCKLLLLLVACQLVASLVLQVPWGLACMHAAVVLKGGQVA